MEDEQEERHEGEQPCAANGHVPSVAQQPRQRVRRGDAPPEAQQPDELHLAPADHPTARRWWVQQWRVAGSVGGVGGVYVDRGWMERVHSWSVRRAYVERARS
eukprot:120226-Prymnesium_polylepis.1